MRASEHDLVVVAHPVVVDTAVVLSELEVGFGTHPVVAPDTDDVPLEPEHRRGDGLRGFETVLGHIALARLHGRRSGNREQQKAGEEGEPENQSQSVLPVWGDILTFLKKRQ